MVYENKFHHKCIILPSSLITNLVPRVSSLCYLYSGMHEAVLQFDWPFENNRKHDFFSQDIYNLSNNDAMLSLSNNHYNVSLLFRIKVAKLALPTQP